MTLCVVPPTNCVTETHQGAQRVDGAGNDVLEPRDDLGADYDRVDGLVRQGCMAALAEDRDPEGVRRGHRRPVHDTDLADLKRRPHVGADHQVDAIHDAGADHLGSSAGEQLFRVLKHEAHLAGQLVRHRRQYLRGAEQHRGMRIVPARVHGARPLRAEVEVVLFLNR